jgi:tetratricopeptide (TPR) repeat protein
MTTRTTCLLLALAFLARMPAGARTVPQGNTLDLAAVRELIDGIRYREAEVLARELLEKTEAEHGAESIETARVLDLLVESLWRDGRVRGFDTLALAERVVAIKEKVEGPRSAEAATSLNNLANALGWSGRIESAESLFEHVLGLREELLGPEHADVATTLYDRAWALYATGRNAEAARSARRALAIRESAAHPDDQRLASTLHLLAVLVMSSAEIPRVRRTVERAVALQERTGFADHPDGADSLHALAVVQGRSGDRDKAGQFQRRAVELRERWLDSHHPKLAQSLSDLAVNLGFRGDHEEALLLNRRALEIRERAFGALHPKVASSHDRVGSYLMELGRHEEAAGHYERALSILEQLYGPDHPEVAVAERDVGYTLRTLGRYHEAAEHEQRAVEILRKAHGPESIKVAVNLHMFAVLDQEAGRHAEALAHYREGLRICEVVHGAGHPHAAKFHQGIGWCALSLGEWTEARRSFERALAIRRKTLGPEHSDVASSLAALGVAAAYLGDYARAGEYKREALRIWQATEGPDSAAVARGLFELGTFLVYRLHRADEALPLLQRSLSTYERLGHSHMNVLFPLALALRELGDHEAAIMRGRQVVALAQRHGAPDEQATAHTNLAGSLEAAGRFDEARRSYVSALSLLESTTMARGPDVANTMTWLGVLEWKAGDLERALHWSSRASDLLDRHTRDTLALLPEAQALRLVGTRLRPEEILASGLLRASDDRARWLEATWDWSLRRRGAVLEELAARRREVLEAESPEARAAWRRLAEARRQLSVLWVREQESAPGERQADELSSLARATREKEQAEQALASLSAAYREARSTSEITLDRLREALPSGAALVEYVRVPVLSPRSEGREVHDIALVLPGGDRPATFADLGPSSEIDRRARSWRAALHDDFVRLASAGESAVSLDRLDERGTRLREAVWDPVAEWIGDAKTVFVVADGPLHQVHLGALPSSGGNYLLEDGPALHMLSTARDLVRLRAKGGLGSAGKGVLALGAPDYDAGATVRLASLGDAGAATTAFRGERSECPKLGEATWRALPESAGEASDVALLFERHEKPATLLVGAAASEERFKREAPGKRVLHLATHGFFLQGGCASALAIGRGIGTLKEERESPGVVTAESAAPRPPPTSPVVGENPLLLSGLALAGANRGSEAGNEGEDGILTAEEIAALDLRGVEIASLSACDTGLGTVEVGEGVFGLRRALEIAGVRTVLMSLWPVPDAESREWMTRFYESRLDGASITDAGRGASLAMLKRLREEGRPTHPYLWAGFVAAGDWR